MPTQAEENKRKLEFLRLNGVNVKVDGSWGPWQEEQYKKLTTKDKHYQTTPLGYLSYLYDKAFGETTYLEDPDYVKGYSGELTEDTRSDARRWVDHLMQDNKTPLGYVTLTVAPAAATAAALVYGTPVVVNGVTKGAPLLYNGVRTAVTNPATIKPTLLTGILTGLRLGKLLGKELVKGVVGMGAVNVATKATTGKTWGELVSLSTGVSPEFGEILNPGAYAPTYLKNVAKRGVETAMRTIHFANPIETIGKGMSDIIKLEPKRAFAIGNYILTGTKLGNKGYYNSFNPQYMNYYSGFNPIDHAHDYLPENDLIDAFLYKKPISPKFGVTNTGSKDYGIHSGYVKKYYPNKDILVYEVSPNLQLTVPVPGKDLPLAPIIKENTGSNIESMFYTSEGWVPDVSGHLREYSYDLTGQNMSRGLDIWKFNPDEYIKGYGYMFRSKPGLWAAKLGLKTVDYLGTPVITRTKWLRGEYP